MIFVNKSKEDPDISAYKKKRWTGMNNVKMTLAEKDKEKAIHYYGDPNKFKNNQKLTEEPAIEFQAYNHEETKKLLKEIFKGKCAYCESFIMAVAPGDIEHFRPKAKIKPDEGDDLVPGYYWLGADWNNLLLSCSNCNRPIRQHINGQDELISMGKSIKFPLSDNNEYRRTHEDDVSEESPFVLLLNPCEEDPLLHLTFTDDGEVSPAILDDNSKSRKGEKSIEVYGLYRSDLVKSRLLVIKILRNSIMNVFEGLNMLESIQAFITDDDVEFFQKRELKRLDANLESLVDLLDSKSQYLAMKKQYIERFLDKHPSIQNKLLAYEFDLVSLVDY